MNRPSLLEAVFLFFALLFVASSAAAAEAGKPNIILFLVDDMGLMDTSVPMLTDEAGRGKARLRIVQRGWTGDHLGLASTGHSEVQAGGRLSPGGAIAG